MALRPTSPSPPAVAATPGSPAEPSEHIFLGSDDLGANPATAGKTIRAAIALRNPLRHSGVDLTLFDEGVLRITHHRKGGSDEPYHLDLRFLDPVPTIERVLAKRWLLTTLGCAALAGLATFLMRFDAIYTGALVILLGSAVGGLAALYGGIYRSYERSEFCTIHGRTPVLTLTANLGAIKRYRGFVPVLSAAIEEAAERITADTAAYLRAEMREHYRLRGDRVLDNEACAAGTGRILAQFDIQL
jgi:hypothetical protein